MSRNLGRLPSLAGCQDTGGPVLGPWAWEQGPDVRTSPIIPCVEGMRGEAGHHHPEPLPPAPKKGADDRRRARRHGIDQLTVRGGVRWEVGARRAERPRCAWRATILRVEVGGWVWRGGWSLGQVRSGLPKGLLASQPQRDIGRGGHGPADWGSRGWVVEGGLARWGLVCLYHGLML